MLTFLLGLLVGYWLWRIRWRKIRPSSSATFSASQFAGGQSSDTQLQLDRLEAEHRASETARTQLEKSFSALKFEHGGLRTALAEREDQVKGLLLDVDRAKVSSSPADATKISTLSGEIDTHKTRVQGLLGEVDAHKEQTSKLNAVLTTVRSQYESLQAAATAERQTAVAEARSQVAGQVTEDLTSSLTKDITDRVRAESNAEHEAIMNARLASMKSDHEGLLSALRRDHEAALAAVRSEHEGALSGWRSRVGELEAELGSVRAEIEGVRASSGSSAAELNSVRAEVGGLHDQLNSIRAELDSERTSFTQQHSQLSSQAEAERAQFRRQLVAMEEFGAETDRLRAELSASTKTLQEANRNCESHDAQIHALQSDLSQLRTSHTEAEELMNSLRNEGERLRHELTAAQNETHSVRSHLAEESGDEPILRVALDRANLKLAPSLPTWSRKAGYLAAGDQDRFAAYTEDLVAGQDPTTWTAGEDNDPDSGDSRVTRVGEFEVDESGFARRLRNPKSGEGDYLQRIEGIGPKIDAALKNAGISTFVELANATDATLRLAIEAAGMTFAPSLVTWAGQSRYLANGDEAGFSAYTERLSAGRPEEA